MQMRNVTKRGGGRPHALLGDGTCLRVVVERAGNRRVRESETLRDVANRYVITAAHVSTHSWMTLSFPLYTALASSLLLGKPHLFVRAALSQNSILRPSRPGPMTDGPHPGFERLAGRRNERAVANQDGLARHRRRRG